MPAVLNLAAAAQVDLGRSADVVSNIMTGFGLTADDTGHAVDVLVKTMTTANTDLPMLGDAMKYVAPVAVSLGLSMEETAAAVGKMSDAGIQGSQAGTALRAMLLSLANPTGQTAEAMEALGIEVTDSTGAMKPLPELIGHIGDKLSGMEEAQKTATAAQLVGTEAASGFLALLSVGEDGLRDYTKVLENAGGTAEKVATKQMDTLHGSFKEFQSALEGVGIAIGEEFLPVFTDIVRFGTDVVRMLGELNPGVMRTGFEMAGTAAAIGLVTTTVLKLVTAMRTLMISMGPAGWVIAGLSIIGGLVVGLNGHYERLNEVNLETAQSFNDQHTELSEAADAFHNLRVKANLTTEELGELLDIREKMANTDDAGALEVLQGQYDKLREKSGLTNEELDKLIGLNDVIIEKAPHVAEAHSQGGNAIAGNNDKLREYIQLLQDTALEELELERMKWAENRETHVKAIRDAELEIKDIKAEMNMLADYQNLTQDEIYSKLIETSDKLTDYMLTDEQIVELERERDILQGILDDGLAGHIQKLQDQKAEHEEIIGKAQTEIDKGAEIDRLHSNILLKKVGINSEGEEGIKIAETQLTKLREQKTQIEQHIQKHGDKNGLSREQLGQLDGEIRKHEEILRTLNRETGLSSEILNTEKRRHDQVRFISDTLSGQENIARRINTELGKSISKRVNIVTVGDTRGISASQYHTGGIAGKPAINQLPKLHTGGLASQLMNAPLHNEVDARLLRNEMVLTEAQQANLMRMIDAGHTQGSGISSDLASRIEQLVSAIGSSQDRPITVKLEADGRELAEVTYPYIDSEMAIRTRMASRINGIRR